MERAGQGILALAYEGSGPGPPTIQPRSTTAMAYCSVTRGSCDRWYAADTPQMPAPTMTRRCLGAAAAPVAAAAAGHRRLRGWPPPTQHCSPEGTSASPVVTQKGGATASATDGAEGKSQPLCKVGGGTV